MWKWLGGCAAVVVILVIAGGAWAYFKFEKFTAAGGSTTVAIHAPPSRVFATLANADSLSAWAGSRTSITTNRHGFLQVGDTIHAEAESPNGARQTQFTWMVAEVQPDHLLVLELRNDRSGKVIATRRDSLTVVGDSTMIVCTVASPAMDSVRTAAHDTGGAVRSTVLDVGSKVMVSAFRLESEMELARLKAHIEGTSPPGSKQ